MNYEKSEIMRSTFAYEINHDMLKLKLRSTLIIGLIPIGDLVYNGFEKKKYRCTKFLLVIQDVFLSLIPYWR